MPLRGLGGDDVDEAAGDVDQLSDVFAFGMSLDAGAGEGHFPDFVLGDGGGGLEAVSEASVDLDYEGDYFLFRQGGVPLGEGTVVDAVGMAVSLPKLLGDVGGEGGQHQQEVLGAFAP